MTQYNMQLDGAQVQWLGHSTFKITSPRGKVILIDPWVQHNPACPPEAKHIGHVDVILATHGHSDHIGDLISIAQATHPIVICILELSVWLQSQGVENLTGINKGGTITIDDINITMTHALHTSSVNGNAQYQYVGEPAGFVLELENDLTFYHAGDTAIFSEMQFIEKIYKLDIAMLPIGGFFTMGPREAAYATQLLGIKHVIPMHYGTFPVLTGTPAQLREELQSLGLNDVEVVEMRRGQMIK
jgi:L-ascorbate metabolism protein UlaG (beta-lactamase superfamily)